MKFSILFLAGLLAFSCQNNKNNAGGNNENLPHASNKNGVQKITLSGIDNHPNKKHMEWFLNNYKEQFIFSESDWKPLVHEELMQKGYSFKTKSSNIDVILIFCKHQDDALIIAESNFPVINNIQIAGVNGAFCLLLKEMTNTK